MIAERGLEHIDEVDTLLVSWAEEVLGDADVTVGPPGMSGEEEVVLHLLEIRPRQPARGATPAPLTLQLRYLVSAWSDPPEAAHRRLGSLAFAALEDERLEFDPLVPPSLWRDLGVPPRAGFVIGIELTRPRAMRSAPLVERPLEVVDATLGTVHGRLLTASDLPVPGVAVEPSDASRRRVHSGNDGRFVLQHALSPHRQNVLRFTVKDRTCTIAVEARGARRVPLDFEMFTLLLDYEYRD